MLETSLGSGTRPLDVTLWISAVAPAVISVCVMVISTGGRYAPGRLLLAMSAATFMPLLALRFVAGVELRSNVPNSGRTRSVLARVFAAWLPMMLIATTATVTVEWTTYYNLPGSSTNPVVPFVIPVIMSVVGLFSYGVAWAGTVLVEHWRRGSRR